MLEILKSLFGLNGSVTNTISGIANHAALAGAVVYIVEHADKSIHLGDVSLGTLGILCACGYFMLELNRRSAP